MPKKSADPEIIANSSSVNVGSLRVDLKVKVLAMMVMLIGVRIIHGRDMCTGCAPLYDTCCWVEKGANCKVPGERCKVVTTIMQTTLIQGNPVLHSWRLFSPASQEGNPMQELAANTYWNIIKGLGEA